MSDVSTTVSPPPTKTDQIFDLLVTQGAELLKLAQAAETSFLNVRANDAVVQYQQALALLDSVWPESERRKLADLSPVEQDAILSRCGYNQALRDTVSEAWYLVANGDKFMGARLAMGMATCALNAQDYGTAASKYQSAAEQLNDFIGNTPSPLSSQANYAQGMGNYAAGLVCSSRGQRDEAVAQIELAIETLENDVLPSLKSEPDGDKAAGDQFAAFRDGVLMDLMGMKATRYMLWLSNQAIEGDFNNGVQVAVQVLNQIKEAEDLARSAHVSAPLRQLVLRMLNANTVVARAYQAYFQAEKSRNQRDWDAAESQYANAKMLFVQAASMLSVLQPPAASELRLISDLFVGQGRRSCGENRQLWELSENHRKALSEIAKGLGVQVTATSSSNSTAESTAISTAKIKQEISYMQLMEKSTRDNLSKLADALESSSVPQEQKDKLLGELSDLQKDDSRGSGFFDKVASFCKKAKPIFDAIASAAGPAAQIFAALHGIPPIPIGGLTQV